MAKLSTDYRDDVLNTSENTLRKYNMIHNEDGTVSFEDVTLYKQIGSFFGAADINATNAAVNFKLQLNDPISGGTYVTEPWMALVDYWENIPLGMSAGQAGYGYAGYIGNKLNANSGAFLVFSVSDFKMIYYVENINNVWQYTDLTNGETKSIVINS